MGVPGFYSWLVKRYPAIKHLIFGDSLPVIDYLYLDMNGIIYKCVKDESVLFKAQLQPKELEQIWIEVFNYINTIVQLLKPTKMILMALDGVAPRSKMNNQRIRRFRSAKDHSSFMKKLTGYANEWQSEENFKNNSISPGTAFMEELNRMLHFFVLRKIQEDDYWKQISVIFTGSDAPGEGQHKIMEFIRTNSHSFHPDDTHCLYGADADLIMLALTLPFKNLLIIREQFVVPSDKVIIMNSRKDKQIQFQLIYINILKECFNLQYEQLKQQMQMPYNNEQITKDFVFLFFFIGNDFLPRMFAFNIRQKEVEYLIRAFKRFLKEAKGYITGGSQFNLYELARLLQEVAKEEENFIKSRYTYAQKYIRQPEHQKTQKQLKLIQKVKKDTLSMDKFVHMNNCQRSCTPFYMQKFNLTPQQNQQQFTKILTCYTQGLRFVYEYYFVNLPSWSWFYPYHYAPLISDLSKYLNLLVQQNISIPKLILDRPFQPFKQLLCILPKQSYELLPQAFQKHIISLQSKLRVPFDYYPDQFQFDMYGSTKAYESVALIPFLNQRIILEVYEQQIGNLTAEEQKRNILMPSKLYEYSPDNTGSLIESPFERIKQFISCVDVTNIKTLQPFIWKTINKVNQTNEDQTHLLKMPTLNMRKHIVKPLKTGAMNYQLIVQSEIQSNIKLGSIVFYGYPQQHSGRVQAIFTEKQFLRLPRFKIQYYERAIQNKSFFNQENILNKHRSFFQYLIELGQKNYKFVNLKNTHTFYFIIETQTFTRTLQGQFQRVYEGDARLQGRIVSSNLISLNRTYRNTPQKYSFAGLNKQFELNEEVLVLNKEACGWKAKVCGYSQKEVEVELIACNAKVDQKKLLQLVSTNDIFFSMRFVSEVVKVRADIVQTLLGSIMIKMPKHQSLPPQIDIGLNFVDRRNNKLVPNLVRINFADNDIKRNNPFAHLQLSIRALQLLVEYKEKFPEVFEFVERRHKNIIEQGKQQKRGFNWSQAIYNSDLYRDDDECKSIMKVYIWLIEKEETHMPVSSLYSKQILRKRITKLQNAFTQLRGKKQEIPHKRMLVDPNFIFSLKLAKLGTLHLAKPPKNHAIGDQVICISDVFFGHFGVVIGINDNQYQVLFEEPSIGKNNLGGLCENLWGERFKFRDLFNLVTWPQCLATRRKTQTITEKLGWVTALEDFYPKYKSKPILDFNDFDVLLNNKENQRLFPAHLIELIRKIKEGLNQTDIEEGFVVVDNKAQDYKFKYNNKTSYIQKEEANQMIKQLENTTKNQVKQINTTEVKPTKIVYREKKEVQIKEQNKKQETKQIIEKKQINQQNEQKRKQVNKQEKIEEKDQKKKQESNVEQKKKRLFVVQFGQEQNADEVLE